MVIIKEVPLNRTSWFNLNHIIVWITLIDPKLQYVKKNFRKIIYIELNRVKVGLSKGTITIDGLGTLEGEIIGADVPVFGEMVFTTSPSGYIKSLTDPSYRGQILVFSFPYIGAYGTEEAGESNRIMVNGAVFSHIPEYRKKELDDFLRKNNTPGIIIENTRKIVDHIRKNGNKLGAIGLMDLMDPYKENLVDTGLWKDKSLKKGEILIVDLGIKGNILESISDFQVDVIPYKLFTGEMATSYKGLIISNGPGDPAHGDLRPFGSELMKVIGNIPTLGICLGHQLISLYSGYETYKMKFGHRSINHPVKDLRTGRIGITTHNHGFSVKYEEGNGLNERFISLNDSSLEGLEGRNLITVQFHPEGGPGPRDELKVFEEFLGMVKKNESK